MAAGSISILLTAPAPDPGLGRLAVELEVLEGKSNDPNQHAGIEYSDTLLVNVGLKFLDQLPALSLLVINVGCKHARG